MIKGMCAVKKLRQEVLPELFVTFKLRRVVFRHKFIVFFKICFAAGSRALETTVFGSNITDPVEILYGSLIHFEDQQIRVVFTVSVKGIVTGVKIVHHMGKAKQRVHGREGENPCLLGLFYLCCSCGFVFFGSRGCRSACSLCMTAFLDLTEQVENTVGVIRAAIGKIVGINLVVILHCGTKFGKARVEILRIFHLGDY